MEKFAVGPMLSESVAAALRHWILFILVVIALVIGFLTTTVLLTHCVLSVCSSSLPEPVTLFVLQNFEAATGIVARPVIWIVCGYGIHRLLRMEARKIVGLDSAQPRKGFGRCVLYLASLSVVGYLFDAAFIMPNAYFTTLTERWSVFAIYSVALVCIYGYLDARFAIYIASSVCDRRSEGFVASWQRMWGRRRSLILLFVLIELVPYTIRFGWSFLELPAMPLRSIIIELQSILSMPPGSLQRTVPGMMEFAAYLGVSNFMIAGGFFAAYRHLASARPEVQAAVFD